MKYGIDYAEIQRYAQKIESAGVSMQEIADSALKAAGDTAVSTFKDYLPYDFYNKDSFHARDNVNIGPIQSGKGGRYRVVGVFEGGAKRKWDKALYLFYVEYGTRKMPARPFLKNAKASTEDKTVRIMKTTVEKELKKRFG